MLVYKLLVPTRGNYILEERRNSRRKQVSLLRLLDLPQDTLTATITITTMDMDMGTVTDMELLEHTRIRKTGLSQTIFPADQQAEPDSHHTLCSQ